MSGVREIKRSRERERERERNLQRVQRQKARKQWLDSDRLREKKRERRERVLLVFRRKKKRTQVFEVHLTLDDDYLLKIAEVRDQCSDLHRSNLQRCNILAISFLEITTEIDRCKADSEVGERDQQPERLTAKERSRREGARVKKESNNDGERERASVRERQERESGQERKGRGRERERR
ncbi:hypothetical protein L484_005952 [Morus notabilis]|uniref:Uncharacterized protein n=1 Tax=Morus notabilis TaxID=981085 RepID=W9RE92_9ROSA|nr:hypothetical protein L484_005952 [Morus notabilis]